MRYRLGIDIGSTTVKIALLDESDNILYSNYKRHYSDIKNALCNLLPEIKEQHGNINIYPVITGSGGLSLSKTINIPFVQEVVCVSTSLKKYNSSVNVAIELGGEDAKIIYFENGNIDQRMNGICAGGTGSFIDQIASLLQTDASGLNELAKDYKSIYTIAARCGVFAKSDIQPLINDGARKEDLAASVFQAVVNQTISGLACGKPIRGYVAFLGGPLHFLSELTNTFIRTLNLDDNHAIIPCNSHLYAAIGSALNSKYESSFNINTLINTINDNDSTYFEVERLNPLFKNKDEYELFKKRHQTSIVKRKDINLCQGKCYLGIDAGSTTTKFALIDESSNLIYSFYSSNNGNPLKTCINALKDIYSKLPQNLYIAGSCSTGYGEALIKSALNLDFGEVETISHFYAARYFKPDVDCILDIGGQDMKCIRIKDGIVDNVLLNEACSSGCGSFIETFSSSLNLSIEEFANKALFAKHPIDLGTRCTVFMNSKVKQAQKEGASVSDISAGLAYSVIKNALYKVIKITDSKGLGKNIVVQGGTFYNESVLRALELITNGEVTRPDISGIMGAFGAALIAKEKANNNGSSTISLDELNNLKVTVSMTKCTGCTNNCRLTINTFNNSKKFISGNRCEKGLGKNNINTDVPNLFKEKLKIIFSYKSLDESKAKRGVIGIPRALNIYENYPLWHTLFTNLGFSVLLSPPSSHALYTLGIESIPSESECYPAKLVHGHIKWLINNNVKSIFYPCIPYERNESKDANNYYNCPIVTSYPENIKNNIEEISEGKVKLYKPFLSLNSIDSIVKGIMETMSDDFSLEYNEVYSACKEGLKELNNCREKIIEKGQEALKYIDEHNIHGIVLAGRPYHIDSEINHGIPELITSYNIAVLTEDSISNISFPERPLIVMDQWMYHSRLYNAASFVKTRDNLDLIQLNSFGCGLDAITTDQVNDILSNSGKIYTCLKIDEVNNLGAARIRIRSLIAAINIRKKLKKVRTIKPANIIKTKFTKKMKSSYTILCPQMSPIHFDILEAAFRKSGYNVEILDNDGKKSLECGLKYVNNDACYPSLLVVGQLISAIESGKYDVNKTALLITQTGGGCRATNYIGFIRRALKKAGYPNIPVISLNLSGFEKHPGFKLTLPLIIRGIYACILGDMLMRLVYSTRPYEKNKGEVNNLHKKWTDKSIAFVSKNIITKRDFTLLCNKIVSEFDNVERINTKKPKVGIVGEILVKFSPMANNNVVSLIENEGGEAVVPDLLDFLLYCFYNNNFKSDRLYAKKISAKISNIGINFLESLRKPAKKALDNSKHFSSPNKISDTASMASKIVSLGNQTGEGWFLTGEILELINEGTNNIICAQPFGCLPNHIVGKGVIKTIRNNYPNANIVAIDYDPGASEVNQLNRIKLMLANAFNNL